MGTDNDDQLDVVVVGSCITDFISYVENLPRVGETVKGNAFDTGFGGKGANQCVAAAKLGSKTGLVAKLGDDVWGEKYKEHLEGLLVNTQHLQLTEGLTTGIAQINVASNGDNQIVIVPGANDVLSIEDVTAARDLIDSAKVLVCQLETPVKTSFAAVRGFKGISILNASPAPAENNLEIFTLPTILCINELEAGSMTNRKVPNIEEAKRAITNFLCLGCQSVIITLGPNGAAFASADQPKVIHLRPRTGIRAIDTTGAGDAFIGALAHYLARMPALPMVRKVGAACHIASLSVQKKGTQTSYPTAVDLEEFDIENQVFDWNYVN